jgi:hypothetical protein
LTISGVAASFEGIAAGDFNHDRKLDLAISEFHSNNVWIVIGNGDGTFAASATKLDVGKGPLAVVAGDLNGDGRDDHDGKPDIIVTDSMNVAPLRRGSALRGRSGLAAVDEQ